MSQSPAQRSPALPQERRHSLLHRLAETGREPVAFVLDGQAAQALAGDTVLTAILLHRPSLRVTEFSAEHRAGFCLMGACQDCWVRLASGARVRACSTMLEDGMQLCTQPAPLP